LSKAHKLLTEPAREPQVKGHLMSTQQVVRGSG